MPSQDDKKQNRLSSLSQDVIAVPKKEPPSQSRPEPKPESRAVPAAQDVFRVQGNAPAAKAAPAPLAAGRTEGKGVPPSVIVLGVLVALALLGSVQLFSTTGSLREAVDQGGQATGKLEAQLRAADERIAKLEARLGAADEDTQKMGSGSQASLLQVSASLRGVRDDVENLQQELARLSAQVNEVRPLAGAAQKDARAALGQVDQLSARLGQVSDQAAAAAKGAKPADGADVQAQLKAVNQKTDKLAGDIRQLYRVLEGQGN